MTQPLERTLARMSIATMHVWTYGPDRIKHELQDAYYARSAFNICRVIKGRELPSDTAPEKNVYSVRARRAHVDRRGIVLQDTEPALYVYYQTFTVSAAQHTRRGLCAMVERQDYSTGEVKPHERTLDAPKQDRFRLLLTTDTHFGQIFQLDPDDKNEVADSSRAIPSAPRTWRGRIDEEGEVRQVWAVDDPRHRGGARGNAGQPAVYR